jgi:hypothetical protein
MYAIFRQIYLVFLMKITLAAGYQDCIDPKGKSAEGTCRPTGFEGYCPAPLDRQTTAPV